MIFKHDKLNTGTDSLELEIKPLLLTLNNVSDTKVMCVKVC